MNGWSAPIVMNANRYCVGLIFGLALSLPSLAHAQESAAQSLYGVKEILVRPVRFDDPDMAKSCRLQGADMDALLLQELKDNGLPAMAEKDAKPSTGDVARIFLVPQIVPYNSQGLDCITWVSLSAESRNHLRVLPVQIPRIINVVYWHHGQVVASAVSVHGEHVSSAIHSMIREFGQHYTAAQPPTIGPVTTPAPR